MLPLSTCCYGALSSPYTYVAHSFDRNATGISEDDVFRESKDIQAIVDKATEDVAKLGEKKRAELEAA